MAEPSLEKVLLEEDFVDVLKEPAEPLFRLINALRANESWSKRHYFQLISEAEVLESLLDDYGARYNRRYSFFTELVASVRGIAMTAYSVQHLSGRIDSYGWGEWFDAEERSDAVASFRTVRDKVRGYLSTLMSGLLTEARDVGLTVTDSSLSDDAFGPIGAQLKLPRNVGQDEPEDEEQKIASFATHFIQASEMLSDTGIERIDDPAERRAFLARCCTEEQARVYEATVHNLQSAYDTHIKNTVLEAEDGRLPALRGYASAALHALEAVTFLTHFCERHEEQVRSQETRSRMEALIDRHGIQELILNHLLLWAGRLLTDGRRLADELLPSYTNVQELRVDVPEGVVLHARPAALIVAIVNRHETPVEMEVAGRRCNAASILELLITVGSYPDERRFVFRGDERPLHDIAMLFEAGLGEDGVDKLPDHLAYLRTT